MLILRNNDGKSCKNVVLEEFCNLVTFLTFVLFFFCIYSVAEYIQGGICVIHEINLVPIIHCDGDILFLV